MLTLVHHPQVSALDRAIALEAADRVVEAADLYEEILRGGRVRLDAYLNLAFLYWQSTEFGFMAALGLDDEFVARSEMRYKEILDECDRVFPGETETIFWRRYFPYASLAEPDFDQEVMEFVHQDGSLVPYFYLYVASNGSRFVAEAEELLQVCRTQRTLKNRYIISMIEGVRWSLNLPE